MVELRLLVSPGELKGRYLDAEQPRPISLAAQSEIKRLSAAAG